MFVSDLMDMINEKLYWNQRKNKITKLYFNLKIVKNYHYIRLIYRIKNMKMYNWK